MDEARFKEGLHQGSWMLFHRGLVRVLLLPGSYHVLVFFGSSSGLHEACLNEYRTCPEQDPNKTKTNPLNGANPAWPECKRRKTGN